MIIHNNVQEGSLGERNNVKKERASENKPFQDREKMSPNATVFRGLISILGHYDIQLISLPS